MMNPTLSPQIVDFEQIWGGLSEGLLKIVNLQSGTARMPMYEDIYKLCIAHPQPYSEDLYMRLKSLLERHVDSLRESILKQQSDLLSDYLKKWIAYSTGSEYVHHIFRYLNANWIKKRLDESRSKLGGFYQGPVSTTDVYEVYTLALVIWRDRLFNKVKDRLIRALLELITKERNGEQVSQSEIAGVIASYVKLGVINKNKTLEIYRDDFETPYLIDTREYYARESSAFIAANGISAYMIKAEQRLEEEQIRAKKYLDPSSEEKLRKEWYSVLIDRHKELMHNECEGMFRDDKLADLSRMYGLLSRIDGLKPMLDVLQTHVEAVGLDAIRAVQAASDPKLYVETLLGVYQKFSDVVKKAFNNDTSFVAALDKACRKIINENSVNESSTKTPELLAKYCDLLLKKSKINSDEKVLEEKMKQVILIFNYVDDKDIFQKFYSKMLARRLIHGTSISNDMESYMIGGLKQACGYEYTSKLQRMFADINISGDIVEKFKETVASKKLDIGKVDFNILVLTSGSWPLHDQLSYFTLPQELEKCVSEFAGYYTTHYPGRKLQWLHHLSKGDLKTNYLKRKYELQVTGYQLGVLLLFNKMEKITLDDVMKGTGLKDQDLKRTVQSLIEANLMKKSKIGAETPVGPSPSKEKNVTVEDDDQFYLNTAFQNKRLKLKITAGIPTETPQSHTSTMESIKEDRKLYLQAAIVRIMKARKTLLHNHLVQEVLLQSKSRFTPNIPLIKKCIEQLIEKEYLERVEGTTSKYSYVA